MGRKKIILSEKEFSGVEYMAKIHCTGEEIAGVLGIDYDTLNRNIKEKYKMGISEFLKKHSASGNMSLRRAQWNSAENGNVTMQIFLGKQWLGQTDKIETNISKITPETRKAVEEMIYEATERKRKTKADN